MWLGFFVTLGWSPRTRMMEQLKRQMISASDRKQRRALPHKGTRRGRTPNTLSVLAAVVGAGLLMTAAAACGSGTAPIIFTSDRDGNHELYSGGLNGDGQTNLTNTPEDESSPIVSPDGKLIAFQSGPAGKTKIEVMRLDGTSRTALTPALGMHRSQRWAPASDRVAYVEEQVANPLIYVASVGGSAPVLLTSISGDEVGDWSLDGNSVVFAVRGGDARGIYIRNPDGVNEFRVTETPDYSPVWSPDSRMIAFLSTRDGNPELYVMNADGSDQRRLTETAAAEYHISWSPDGKRLLHVSDRDGNPEIYVADRDGSNQLRLTHNGVRDEQPVWSPDGQRIAFVSYLDGDAEIFAMDADGGNQIRITNNRAQDTSPSW